MVHGATHGLHAPPPAHTACSMARARSGRVNLRPSSSNTSGKTSPRGDGHLMAGKAVRVRFSRCYRRGCPAMPAAVSPHPICTLLAAYPGLIRGFGTVCQRSSALYFLGSARTSLRAWGCVSCARENPLLALQLATTRVRRVPCSPLCFSPSLPPLSPAKKVTAAAPAPTLPLGYCYPSMAGSALWFTVVVMAVWALPAVRAHAYLSNPVSRNWRNRIDRVDYCPHCLNAGTDRRRRRRRRRR